MSVRFALAAVVLAGIAGIGAAGKSPNGQLPVTTTQVPVQRVTYVVTFASMEPTLHCAKPGSGCRAATADKVVVEEPAHDVKRGDIVAFKTSMLAGVRCGTGPGSIYIKRVIGLPGDRWSERNGFVYVDGKKLAEPYVKADTRDARTIAPIMIPPGRYFVMGDARSWSCDSRVWGTVPAANLISKVVKIVRGR